MSIKKVLVSVVSVLSMLLLIPGCAAKTPENDVYLTLVNKQNQLPSNWTEMIQLESAKNVYDEEFLVEKEALKNFNELRDELLAEGIDIELDSTYRSVEEQQEIWDEWSNDPELGVEYCKKYLAVPGFSEHHTGLAIDVFLIKDGEDIRENDDMIAERETFAKVHEKLAKHGFILRYLEGKMDVTGYAYEPWHFRYVGSPKIAEEIMSQGITLEEYLQNR